MPQQIIPEQANLIDNKIDSEIPNIGDNFIAGIGHPPLPGIPNNQNDFLNRLVYVPPSYPPEAAIKGLEGWVIVEFTVEPNGQVTRPKVIESSPKRIFDRAAIHAVLKWKFKAAANPSTTPKTVKQRIDFNLAQS